MKIKLPDGKEIEDRRIKKKWVPFWEDKRTKRSIKIFLRSYKDKIIKEARRIEEDPVFGETEERDA